MPIRKPPPWQRDSHQTASGNPGAVQIAIGETLAIFGQTLGRSFDYVQFPVDAVADRFRQAGASSAVIETYIDMFNALAEPSGAPPQDRMAALKTQTGAAEFAKRRLAAVVGGSASRDDR
jgi:hypothetical protein